MEILSIVNMVPAVVTYKQDGEEKSVIVYLDYASQNLIPTEDVGPIEEFRQAVFGRIARLRKPAVVPDIPRSGFGIDPKSFNNPG